MPEAYRTPAPTVSEPRWEVMMARAVVLGAGMVGSLIAEDLAADFDVTLVDRSEAALQRAKARIGDRLTTSVADLSDPAAIAGFAGSADVVCGALASHLGYGALRAVLTTGTPYCDISFMPEDAWTLDALAKEHGTTAVVDCGVAPGMSNLLSGWGVARLEEARALTIRVGGLPVERTMPFQYKAGFAPADVIEEYTRPARLVENGTLVVREALTALEIIELPHVGSVETFNTDGLRSLAYTLKVPNMREQTLRWPGHVALMHAFREAGLFSKEPVTVGGVTVRPLDVTSAVLFPKWTYEDGEADLTVMRVEVSGLAGGKPTTLTWDLFDVYDPVGRNRSMSRTTAFPCATVARMLVSGAIAGPGVLVPEQLGAMPGVPEAILAAMQVRGVRYQETVTFS
jgi:saccharopine dehydrogenase-like NADP-dependent oxidoreductase